MITYHNFSAPGTIKTGNQSPYLFYLSKNQSNVTIHVLEDLLLVSCCSLLGPFCVLEGESEFVCESQSTGSWQPQALCFLHLKTKHTNQAVNKRKGVI